MNDRLADKGIGPGRERGLLAGIQVADQDDDERGWAGQQQFGQDLFPRPPVPLTL
jgi:hypothetical protein